MARSFIECTNTVLPPALRILSFLFRATILTVAHTIPMIYLSTNYPEYEVLCRIAISFAPTSLIKFLCHKHITNHENNTPDLGRRVATWTNNSLSWPVFLVVLGVSQLVTQSYLHDAIPDDLFPDTLAHSAVDFVVGLFPEPFQPWVRKILP